MKDTGQASAETLMRQLDATPQGLSGEEASRRLAQYGTNEIPEKTTRAWVQFIGYLWGPIALVTTTGAETYFGRTAKLVADAGNVSHFQKAVLKIDDMLIYLSLGLVVVLMPVQL